MRQFFQNPKRSQRLLPPTVSFAAMAVVPRRKVGLLVRDRISGTRPIALWAATAAPD